MQLVRGALQRGEVVAQGAGNRLFQGLFERCFPWSQRNTCLFSIMETVTRGVNGHYGSAFLPCSGRAIGLSGFYWFRYCANWDSARLFTASTIFVMCGGLRRRQFAEVTPKGESE